MNSKLYCELNGRLGNQMFIYAFCRSLSLELNAFPVLYDGLIKNAGIEYRLDCFELPTELRVVSTWKASLLHRFGLIVNSLLTNKVPRLKKAFIQQRLNFFFQSCGLIINNEGYITPHSFLLKRRDVFTIGYFQSERYFADYRSIICKDFQFKKQIKIDCQDWAQKVSSCKNSVCVHIRLGDYLQYPEFLVCSFGYYQAAINKMLKIHPDAFFFIFTDSPEIVKKQLVISALEYIPSRFSDQITLYLGSLCKHHIISNSSFSWWMQYLASSKEQIVFAPSRWMNDGNYSAIYQKHWNLIDV